MEGKTQETAAAKAGMSVRSARKWGSGPLPSETRHLCLASDGVFAAEPQWLFDHPDSTRGFYVWSGGMVSGKRSPRRTARLAVVGAVSECNTDRTAINQTSRSTFRAWMRCVGGHRLWLLPSWPMAILAVRPLQGFEVGIGNAWTQSGNLLGRIGQSVGPSERVGTFQDVLTAIPAYGLVKHLYPIDCVRQLVASCRPVQP